MHQKIIDLGYSLNCFQDHSGVCQGIVMAWLSADLINNEEAYNHRISQYFLTVFIE